jgi:two-component system, sensor histidine kinase PdtaS
MRVGKQIPLEHARKLLRWTYNLRYPARLFGTTTIVAIATLLRWLFDPYMGGHFYTLFIASVAIVSLIFNHLTGLYALGLSAVLAVYLFMEPRYTWIIPETEQAAFFVFLVVSLTLIAVSEIVRMLANALNNADDEKAVLLRELHHRTKNYLQMVSAAIRLSVSNTTHAEVLRSLESVAERVENIGHVGQLLDTADRKGFVDANDYFNKLVHFVSASLIGTRDVAITCHAETILIDRMTAEAMGIVVHELITNALKYAFPSGTSGSIAVELVRKSKGCLCLTVLDNGVGCPPDFVMGTGLRLVSTLVRIRGGSVDIQNTAPGCKVVVHFPESTVNSSAGRSAQQ